MRLRPLALALVVLSFRSIAISQTDAPSHKSPKHVPTQGTAGDIPGGIAGKGQSGIRSSEPNDPSSSRPRPIYAGGGKALRIKKRVEPMYPPEAKKARIEGSVVVAVLIRKDGHIKKMKLISGHPILAPAALDAVRQWVFESYLLHGKPIEVETQITINFRLPNPY